MKKSKKETLSDPTKMPKKEFRAMIKESLAQADRGQVFELEHEDMSKFLGLE